MGYNPNEPRDDHGKWSGGDITHQPTGDRHTDKVLRTPSHLVETIPGTRSIGQRGANAHNNMVETLMERGNLSKEQAQTALEKLKQVKALKMNWAMGRYDVKHGAFMERDVVRRAAGIGEK